MVDRKFPGLSREELLRVFAICRDDAVLEYERSQELLANMRETTAGYAALFALVDLWRSHCEEQRCLIGDASSELADTLDQLNEPKQGRGHNWQNYASRNFLRPKVGITDRAVTMHSLRHTFSTLCREAGMPDAVKYALMGHALGKGEGGSTARDRRSSCGLSGSLALTR